jgi:hypothetical protein
MRLRLLAFVALAVVALSATGHAIGYQLLPRRAWTAGAEPQRGPAWQNMGRRLDLIFSEG